MVQKHTFCTTGSHAEGGIKTWEQILGLLPQWVIEAESEISELLQISEFAIGAISDRRKKHLKVSFEENNFKLWAFFAIRMCLWGSICFALVFS